MGARVEVRALPWPELVGERLQRRDFQAVILGLDFESSWDQLPFWHSSQAAVGGLNFSGLSDPETDLLLQSLALEFDPEAVPDRAHRLESRLAALQPFLPLFTDEGLMAIRSAAIPADLHGQITLAHWLLQTAPPSPPAPRIPMRLPDDGTQPNLPLLTPPASHAEVPTK
jgi:ABC-type transport system substrate-binding protein